MDYYSQWATVSAGIRQGLVTTGEYDSVLAKINSSQISPQEYLNISKEIPDILNVYNKNGELVQQVYKDTRSFYNGSTVGYDTPASLAQQIDSNIGSGGTAVATKTTTVKKVINVATDPQTGKAVLSKNITLYKDGTPTVTQGLASSCLAAIAAAAAGINLGKTIDSTLYNANPDFWDSHGMSELNPETWGNITSGDDSLGATLFNLVFGINPTTGDPQTYIDENAFAYLAAYMMSRGVFNKFELQSTDFDPIVPATLNYTWEYPTHAANDLNLYLDTILTDSYAITNGYILNTAHPYSSGSESKQGIVICIGDENSVITHYDTVGTTYHNLIDVSEASITINDTTYYAAPVMIYNSANRTPDTPYSDITDLTGTVSDGTPAIRNICTDALNLVYNNRATREVQGVPGINNQVNSRQFDTSGITDFSDIAAVLLALQSQFPELWQNRLEFSPDGSTNKIYIPVGFPTGGTGESNQTTTEGATQADTEPKIDEKGDNATDELIKTIIEMLTGDQTDMDTDTDTPADVPEKPADDYDKGDGSTPVPVIPVGSASALWKIYNPSQAELDTFGSWLWSSSFVDQLLKVFSDPMQAIIGLHKIYVDPSVSGSGPIRVGYLTSTATANYVDDQYLELDCGSVSLSEFYGSVYDYDPFTRISLFLPFIGFVDISNTECMRGTISIKYKIDVLTGCCLALVSVNRDLEDVIKYQFSGNCAVQYPVSSGSYVGIVTGLLGIAGGIAGTVLSGGALAPILMGAGASIGSMHTSVQHSGNISANAGAMGVKKPYILVERPQTKYADKAGVEGLPQNKYIKLSTVSGLIKVKTAMFTGFDDATSQEMSLIRDKLSSGVYL